MGLKSDDDTPTILRKLGLFIPSFYAVYYAVACILVASFSLPWDTLARFPFRFAEEDFKPARRGAGKEDADLPLAEWLCQVITFLASTGLSFFIIRSTRKAWDYAVTVAIIHLSVSCAVMQAFPVNWIWWVTIVVLTFLLSTLSEVSIYFLRDMREIEL